MEVLVGTRDGGSSDNGQSTREGGEDVREAEAGGREEVRNDGAEGAEGAERPEAGVASRGDDPPEPKDRATPRIVGRASERGPRAAELHYFLVLTPGRRSPKRVRKFEWKRRDELTTAALAAAFDLLPAERR